jgi:hypothetical protein
MSVSSGGSHLMSFVISSPRLYLLPLDRNSQNEANRRSAMAFDLSPLPLHSSTSSVLCPLRPPHPPPRANAAGRGPSRRRSSRSRRRRGRGGEGDGSPGAMRSRRSRGGPWRRRRSEPKNLGLGSGGADAGEKKLPWGGLEGRSGQRRTDVAYPRS